MKEPVVSDSTCLIGLERIRDLNILPALFAPIMIPPEVERIRQQFFVAANRKSDEQRTGNGFAFGCRFG